LNHSGDADSQLCRHRVDSPIPPCGIDLITEGIKMNLSKTFARFGLALFAAALFAGPASADSECVAACRSTASQCISGARDAFKICQQGFGCDDLRGVLREACFGTDRDREACREASAELRACMEPCIDGMLEDAGMCRFEIESCIAEQCGEDNPLRRLLERFKKYRP
jgi:hypothetical protein